MKILTVLLLSITAIAAISSPVKAENYASCLDVALNQVYTRDVAALVDLCQRIYPQDITIIVANVYIRSGPSFSSGVIRETYISEDITFHSWEGDWAYITDSHGNNGWTHRNKSGIGGLIKFEGNEYLMSPLSERSFRLDWKES